MSQKGQDGGVPTDASGASGLLSDLQHVRSEFASHLRLLALLAIDADLRAGAAGLQLAGDDGEPIGLAAIGIDDDPGFT